MSKTKLKTKPRSKIRVLKTDPMSLIINPTLETNHHKIKLDLSFGDLPEGSGFNKISGLDPDKLPWELGSGAKLKDESVEEAYCAFRFNRIPGELRMEWMAELWRVLVPSGKCTMIVPYWASPRAIQDPCSAWPPLCEQSFLYFNKAFREANKLPEPKNYCDFEFAYGYQLDRNDAAVINGKSDEVRAFWIKHYVNIVEDLHMTLTKRPRA